MMVAMNSVGDFLGLGSSYLIDNLLRLIDDARRTPIAQLCSTVYLSNRSEWSKGEQIASDIMDLLLQNKRFLYFAIFDNIFACAGDLLGNPNSINNWQRLFDMADVLRSKKRNVLIDIGQHSNNISVITPFDYGKRRTVDYYIAGIGLGLADMASEYRRDREMMSFIGRVARYILVIFRHDDVPDMSQLILICDAVDGIQESTIGSDEWTDSLGGFRRTMVEVIRGNDRKRQARAADDNCRSNDSIRENIVPIARLAMDYIDQFKIRLDDKLVIMALSQLSPYFTCLFDNAGAVVNWRKLDGVYYRYAIATPYSGSSGVDMVTLTEERQKALFFWKLCRSL